MRHISSLAVLALFLMLASPALAGTISIFGTNVSNANQNVTKDSTNASVTVTAWTTGIGTKTLSVKGYNASESLTFVLYNFVATQVIERKDNSTSKAAYQANSTGAITFTTTQNAGNITYSFTPAVNTGGYNSSWGFFFDIVIKNGTLENVNILSASVVNVTTFNATTVQGDGYGLSNLNLQNITGFESNITGRGYTTNTTMDKNLSNYTGVVLKASMPANVSYNDSLVGMVKAYNSTNQLNLPNGVATLINLDIESWDLNNEFTANTFTAKETGYYHVDASISWFNTVSGKRYLGSVYINGAETLGIRDTATAGTDDGATTAPSGEIHLNVGDTVALYGTSNDGAGTSDVEGVTSYLTYMSIVFDRRG